MEKNISTVIINTLLLFFLATGCSKGENPTIKEEPILPQVDVSKITTVDGKSFLSVDGIPFPLLGAQVRLDALLNCDKYSISQVEDYFVKAQALGVNCLQIPIWWNLIEPQKNSFSFEVVDKILEYAVHYKIKIELLWFSTNMCGDSFTYLTPQYIMNEPGKKFRRDNEGDFWDYYGYIYLLNLNDAWIIERETNAITKLFNHIHVWDERNGNTHPVITAQIHNEPDILVRWRIDQYHIKGLGGSPMSKEYAWRMVTDAVDKVGQAVQTSSYKVATRVNLVRANRVNGFPEYPAGSPHDIHKLTGIDFVSFDPYVTTLEILKPEILAYKSLPENYPLVAENKGSYENTPSLILASVALGSGYNIYDLATSKFFIDHTSEPDNIDHGVYTWNLQEKDHTPAVQKILKGLILAAPVVAKTRTENFVAFNVKTDTPVQQVTQDIRSEHLQLTFSTLDAALGFAIDDKNAVYIYVTDNATISLSNATFGAVETGKFNSKGNFIKEGDAKLDVNQLNPIPGILYKIPYSGATPQTSSVESFIGK